MKTFKYHLNGQELSIRLDEKRGTIADLLVDNAHPAIASEDMPAYAAVIALALIEHDVEIVHDEEPGIITLAGNTTVSPWADPLQMMNNQL